MSTFVVDINEEYLQSIINELITLEDWIPMRVLSAMGPEAADKRIEFLKDNPEIMEINVKHLKERENILNSDPENSFSISVDHGNNEVKEFINKYPQWAEIDQGVVDLDS